MRNTETWLAGLLWVAVAIGLPVAAFEPVGASRVRPAVLALGACDDGSPHLAMGCASIAL